MGRHGDDDRDGLINRLDPDSPEYEGDAARFVSRAASGAGGGLSASVIRAALAAVGAVGKQIVSFDELAAGAVDALRQAPDGLTKEGAAAFLATCAVESAWFRTTTEYGSGQRYAPYIGRTFVQLTWKENYAGFGRWCKTKGLVADQDSFVTNPASLSSLRWAWLGPVYYFEVHGLWRYGNAGDFRAVSQAVNGGDGRIHTSFTPNSWAERQAMYQVFLQVGPGLVPTQEDDMPSVPEIGQGIWGWPIDDPYTPQGGDSMPAFAALAWAAANAAHARDAAAAAAQQTAGLQAAVNKLAEAVAAQHSVDPDALKQAVADAIAEHVTVTGSISFTPTS